MRDLLALVGLFTCIVFAIRIIAYLRSNRSGNSGRNTHWDKD